MRRSIPQRHLSTRIGSRAIAVKNEDCVDDATTNMTMAKNIAQRNLVLNSKHPAPKKIHTLQRAAKKEKSTRVCSEGKRSWQCLSVAVDSGACDNETNPKDVTAYEEQVKETEASANQENCLAANGEEIDKLRAK